jgi:heterodisulfide reductase subunit C
MDSRLESSSRTTPLAELLRERTGRDPAACYQCAKCSAGCPMTPERNLKPHDILRLINRDRAHEIFADESIWICLTCETCTARCPNGCDPARLTDALREMAPETASRSIRSFHRAFLDQIKTNGRIYEVGLVIDYKLRTGRLAQDVLSVPGMFRRGKLNLVPHRCRDRDGIRRIFDACEGDE